MRPEQATLLKRAVLRAVECMCLLRARASSLRCLASARSGGMRPLAGCVRMEVRGFVTIALWSGSRPKSEVS